jgi:hypothetical protein
VVGTITEEQVFCPVTLVMPKDINKEMSGEPQSPDNY